MAGWMAGQSDEHSAERTGVHSAAHWGDRWAVQKVGCSAAVSGRLTVGSMVSQTVAL
jgi:hypothetical protein